ncbi:MAG: hypothetical protein EP343_13850 [Deltaproteobacteria bacterium]|nr:MAG: hypothetical protein EP343_13850 [Deltaproteobacteria bacterium]
MSRISRSEFVQRYQNTAIALSDGRDVQDKLWAAGTSQWAVSQSDLNGDKKISGARELSALFDIVDRYDTNGSYDSIDTTYRSGAPTRSGNIVSVLDLMVGRNVPVTPSPSTPEVSSTGGISSQGRQQMQDMLRFSRNDSIGRRPDGYCYSHVADYIDRVGYGKIPKWGFNASIPGAYWSEARQFAEYLNQGGNAERLGLKRLHLDNPYDAPEGAIVVVRAGTPGTGHPTAGDIAIKGEGNAFYNGGEMGYGGRQNFYPGNNYVLGIYVPQ